MDRKAFEIHVYVNKDGHIILAQEVMGDDQPAMVRIHPSQVEQVTQWILDARDEALAGAVDGHKAKK